MHHDSAVSALRVDDQDFLVRSTIDRCPKVMMIRELFKNALEAAQQETDGKVIFAVAHEGAPKLSIWNNGPGMDDEELGRMTNLAASIGKVKASTRTSAWGRKSHPFLRTVGVSAIAPAKTDGFMKRSCASARASTDDCGGSTRTAARLVMLSR